MIKKLPLLLLIAGSAIAQDVKAPSKQFLSDYAVYQKKLAHLQKKMHKYQDENDLITGMAQRLSAEIPQGYDFDPELKIFKPKPKPDADKK